MGVQIVQVQDKSTLEEFLHVPFRIYKDDKNQVFPLLSEQRQFFDKKHNPFYNHAESELWIARNDQGEVVGRIGACIDQYNNKHHQEDVGFFGFYEADDNAEVSQLLLETARQWIADQGMSIMRGPGCFTSNHDWYGLQIDGKFNRPVIGMPYNPRYYPEHMEKFGLTSAKDLLAWYLETQGVFPEKMQRLIDRVSGRPGLVVRSFDMKNFDKEASLVRKLYNDCWSQNWGFIPMDDEDFAYSAKDMKAMVDPDFLLVAEMEGVPVGFSLTIPDFNQALQPIRGKLAPFGWLKFLLKKRKIYSARTILMGVVPEYRKLGIDVAMVHQTMQAAFNKGITEGECSWILVDNEPMNAILKGYGADPYKTYRVYEKPVK